MEATTNTAQHTPQPVVIDIHKTLFTNPGAKPVRWGGRKFWILFWGAIALPFALSIIGAPVAFVIAAALSGRNASHQAWRRTYGDLKPAPEAPSQPLR